MLAKWVRIVFLIMLSMGLHSAYAQCNINLNDNIQKIIEKNRKSYQIPGLEVSIICPGEEVPQDFVSGTTMINGDAPIVPTTLFQAGSITKSFIAAILLQLEAQDLLSLDDPLNKWLSNIPSTWESITIRQLLNHTSGLFNNTDTKEFIEAEFDSHFQKQWTPEELVSLVFDKPPYFEVGQGWYYTNTNYVLAGMVITAVTGNTVETEIRTRLIEPLNLTNTYYLPHPYPIDIMQRMAHGYYNQANYPLTDATDFNMSLADAAGALVSNSHDTAIWLHTLLTTNVILPKAQVKELMALVSIEDGQPLQASSMKPGYGLGLTRGFDTKGQEIWGHKGGTFGYISHMIWLKYHNVIITTNININKEEDASNALLNDLINYIHKAN